MISLYENDIIKKLIMQRLMLQHASSFLSAFFNNYTLHYNNFILKVGLKVLLKIKK